MSKINYTFDLKKYYIDTLNYKIIFSNKFAFYFFAFAKNSFKGSTTLFYILFKTFFRKNIYLFLNRNLYSWEIDSVSDFRLLRGDFNSKINQYDSSIGYEGIDLSFIKKIITEGDLVIDIGANKGFYTLFFSALVGKTGKVLSFEASNKHFNLLLKRLTCRWNLINVLPFNFILGNDNFNSVLMKKPSIFDDGTGLFFKKSQNVNSIYQRKLDTILTKLNIVSIKLIKIDVEGAEYNVLKGSEQILQITDYLLIEISDISSSRFGNTVQDVYSFLESHKFVYSYSIHCNNTGESELISGDRNYGNILFSKIPLK